MQLSLKSGFVSLLVILLVPSTSLGEGNWKEISAQDAKLVLYAPGLERAQPSFERWKVTFSHTVERGYWQAQGQEWPRALLVLEEIRPGSRVIFTDKSAAPLPETIKDVFSDNDVTVGMAAEATNHMGVLKTQRFTLYGVTECVYVRQYPAPDTGVPIIGSGGTSRGNILVDGWYCAGPGNSLGDDVIEAFVNSVGVKGWSVPDADYAGDQKTKLEHEDFKTALHGIEILTASESGITLRRQSGLSMQTVYGVANRHCDQFDRDSYLTTSSFSSELIFVCE